MTRANMTAEIIQLNEEIERYRRGISKIKEHLEAKEPEVGDATFICEALLAE